MDFIQYIIAVPWFAGGLLFWPIFSLVRSRADPRRRPLRTIFLFTLGALVALGALLRVVALLHHFNHNWLPFTLLFPVINVVSIILSVVRVCEGNDHAA